MKKKTILFTGIGADPEVFLMNLKGSIISSIPHIKGTKDSPQEVGDGYAIQKDNILAEFNIPPAATKSDFIKHIQTGLELLRRALPKNILLDISTSHIVPESIIRRHKEAMVFGCDPDYVAWHPEFPRVIKVNPEEKAIYVRQEVMSILDILPQKSLSILN